MGKLFLGLVHYPVYNKKKEIITTSITNLDIHDIARSVTTFGVQNYYIIHPLEAQHVIINELLRYWLVGYGKTYNPDRKIALEKVVLKKNIEDVKEDISLKFSGQLKVVVTDARFNANAIDYLEMREKLQRQDDINYLLLFGTGWGMANELMEQADFRLLPIIGTGEYNHLSVRSAAAIIIDRLLGEKWW